MAGQTTRSRRHQRTREAILDAAMELIVEKGFNNLSLREVAQRVDYSPAGLYEYFGSKDELIAAACLAGDRLLGDALSQVDLSLPLDQYLVELGMAYVRFARERTNTFIFLFAARSADMQIPSVELTDDNAAQQGSFALLYNAVQRGIDSGEIGTRTNYTTLDIAYSLWSLVHGMATLQLSYLQNWDYDFIPTDRLALEHFVTSLMQR